MVKAHVITWSSTPHLPGSFHHDPPADEQEPDEYTRAQDVRCLVPTEIVWLMGLAGFILSILAIVTPLRCYIQPCYTNKTVPMTPSYYFARNRPFFPQRPASPHRRPSSASTMSSHSSTSTASSTLLDTPNSESSLQSILIVSHPGPSTDREMLPPTKRVSFKEDLVQQELDVTFRMERPKPPAAPVDVWALAVMDDLIVLEESHTEEFSRANAQKRNRLTKTLSFSARCPMTSQSPPRLSPTPSFSSTMSDPSSNSLHQTSEESLSRGRQTRKNKLFRKRSN